MKKGRKGRKVSYGVWIGLLCKRLWKQPAYICLLLAIPLLGFIVSHMDTGSQQGAVAAVYIEEGDWSGQIGSLLEVSAEEGGVIWFQFCDSDAEVQRQVARGKADCGFVVPADIGACVMGGDWNRRIICYEAETSSIAGMAKERLAAVIFQLYSEEKFIGYMSLQAESAEDAGADSAEMTAFAREAYERRLTDGSTFSMEYYEGALPEDGGMAEGDIDGIGNEQENGSDRIGRENSDTDVINDTGVLPVKGVFAVLIFISGMCGMLEYEKDKKEKRFVRMVPNWMTYLVNIWISMLLPSLAVLLCLWLSDSVSGGAVAALNGGMSGSVSGMPCRSVAGGAFWNLGTWVRQTGLLLAYQVVILLYCGIIRLVLRNREAIAAAIPILTLGCLVCSPVFIRLAAYVPLFAVLEKLFPTTYYLLW